MTIPTTRAAAIQTLVDQDVTRWGEQERSASERIHQTSTFGLALNALASRAQIAGEPYTAMLEAAKATLTATDMCALRNGG